MPEIGPGGIAVLLASVLLVASCASPASTPPPAASGAAAPTRAPAAAAAPPAAAQPAPAAAPAPPAPPAVTSKVRFGHQPLAVFAPVYIAEDRGYFKQEGVELDLITFGN